jgi:hypothetical protein
VLAFSKQSARQRDRQTTRRPTGVGGVARRLHYGVGGGGPLDKK